MESIGLVRTNTQYRELVAGPLRAIAGSLVSGLICSGSPSGTVMQWRWIDKRHGCLVLWVLYLPRVRFGREHGEALHL